MAEYVPTPPSAGWYPDPGGQPGRRYHDGKSWTTHFVPDPPAPVAPQPSVVVNNHVGHPASAPSIAVAVSGGTNHGLHLLLTLLTCGLWLPIWLIIAIFGGGRSVAISGNGAAVQGGGSKLAAGIGVIFVGLVLLGVVVENPWLLAIMIPAALGGAALFYRNKQKEIADEEARKLAVRADYENDLYGEGDPRGTHGRYLPPEELR